MTSKDEAVKVLNKYKKLVWPRVKKILKSPKYPRTFKPTPKYKKLEDFHWKVAADYPTRQGKYLRPSLILLACSALGGNIKKALSTAAAMQVSEEWILIHDDYEDKSLKRRGKPALHRIHGDELAVNAGDALHAASWKLLSENYNHFSVKKANALTEEFYSIIARTALGQSVEIIWHNKGKVAGTVADWEFIADSKSSYYSITGPLRLGAMIAGATPTQIAKLTDFGLWLGRCFQLVDDILDVSSDFSGLKIRGGDIDEGKLTVPMIHLSRSLKGKDKTRLNKIVAKPIGKKTKVDIVWVIKMMEEKGSIEFARKLAEKYQKNAKIILERDLGFLSREPARSELGIVADFILNRSH